jgi:hypothetical protein
MVRRRFASLAAPLATAAAALAASAPAGAAYVPTYAVYYQGTSNHCVVHFQSGRVTDFGWMPLSFCQKLVNAFNALD